MQNNKMSVIIPILMITVGIGWLLTVHQVMPGVDWVWILGLAVVGILAMVVGGINKVTLVVGPFLLICTVTSLLRQTGRLPVDTEVPSLVILAGLLGLAVRFLPVPPPDWFTEVAAPDDQEREAADE